MEDSIAIALGRVEKSVDKVEEKVDKVSTQMISIGLEMAKYGVRLDRVERDVEETKKDLDADTSRGLSLREKLLVASVTLVGSGVVSWIISLITDKG